MACESAAVRGGGLLLPQTLLCTAGVWTDQDSCGSSDGGLASNGCPDSQPANGDPCSLPDGGTWCQYTLLCPTACDAGAPSQPDDAGVGSASGCTSASKV